MAYYLAEDEGSEQDYYDLELFRDRKFVQGRDMDFDCREDLFRWGIQTIKAHQ